MTKKGYRYKDPRNPRKLISRQRLWQLRQKDNGNCPSCGQENDQKRGSCSKCCPRRRKAA